MKRELLIGCGSNWGKRLTADDTETFDNLVTLDYNADHKPDIVWDLMNPYVLPPEFDDNSFDEIHAYEVLEHIGQPGDYRTFFKQFSEFWRVLKPNGHFLATFPSRHSAWVWGDPSHTRAIQLEQLIFLSQPNYETGVGVTSMSDFRNIYKADFDVVMASDNKETASMIIKAIKPSRIKERT